MRLGKAPARPGAVTFALASYAPQLPTPPAVFGHADLVGAWRELGNDRWGNCVWAAAAHAEMLWSAMATGMPRRFTTADVMDDYRDCTGFCYDDPSTDQGTDLALAAQYWRHTGVRDTIPVRHRIEAYLALRPGDVAQHMQAAALFGGGVLLGLEVGDNQEDQFDARRPWSGDPGPNAGGHCVLLVGRRANGNAVVVTWGQLQEVTPAFLAARNDESVACLSAEMLRAGKSPDGLDLASLTADLAMLNRAAT